MSARAGVRSFADSAERYQPYCECDGPCLERLPLSWRVFARHLSRHEGGTDVAFVLAGHEQAGAIVLEQHDEGAWLTVLKKDRRRS